MEMWILDKVKINRPFKRRQAIIFAVVFIAIGGVAMFFATSADDVGLKAAKSPKYALGASGIPSPAFARWLDRDNILDAVRFRETNKHFSAQGVDTMLKNRVNTLKNQPNTLIATIAATPDDTKFVQGDRSRPEVCGTYGTSNDATKNDYQISPGKYRGQELAKNLLGNAKRDNNKNGINDNIENLYRALQGCYDNTLHEIADSIIRYRAYETLDLNGHPELVIRFGHEHDGDWYEWSSTNQTGPNTQKALNYADGKNAEQLYRELWARSVTIIRDRVKASVPDAKLYFELNVTHRAATKNNGNRIRNTWPGDKHVDVVGIDFYDREYPNSCGPVDTDSQIIPDCRTVAEKENGWRTIERNLNTISDFAASRGKLVGVSEHHISATNKGGQWEYGGDNALFVEQAYRWFYEQTTEKGRLAYVIFFEKNGKSASKELADTLNAQNLRSVHKMTPGATNDYWIPTSRDATCVLEWDFLPLDSNGNPIEGASPITHQSRFPKASKRFLQLWSGDMDGGQSTKAGCPRGGEFVAGASTGGGGGGSSQPDQNTAPSVNVGANRSAVPNEAITIGASVSDDGLPSPANLTYSWTTLSGPNDAQFSNANRKNTSVTFTSEGTFVLRLQVNDGELETADTVTITVQAANEEQPPDDTPDTSTDNQFVLFNASVTHTGERYQDFDALEGTPSNWNSPVNYANGKAYARVELTDFPEESDFDSQVQLCMYRDGFKEQLCSGNVPFNESVPIYAEIGSPVSNTWFKRNKSWDFTKPFERMRLQFKNAETGNNLLTTNCGSTCSTSEVVDAFTPFTISVQIVLVAQGSNITPLESWIDCPVEFGCIPDEGETDEPQEDPAPEPPKEEDPTDTNPPIDEPAPEEPEEPETPEPEEDSTPPQEDEPDSPEPEDEAPEEPQQEQRVEGDVNGDGDVGLEDFFIIRSNFNRTGVELGEGDLNGDGVVNLADFFILRNNWTR